jgi:hypothetical protein
VAVEGTTASANQSKPMFTVNKLAAGSVVISTKRKGEIVSREYKGLSVTEALAEFVKVLDIRRSYAWKQAERASIGIRNGLASR